MALRPVVRTAVPGVEGGVTTATAKWSPPRSNGGSKITGYQVTALRLDSTGAVVSSTTSQLLASSARALRMELAAGAYRFQVRAYNDIGTSPLSVRSNRVASR